MGAIFGIFLISTIDRSVGAAKSGRIIKVGNSGKADKWLKTWKNVQ
jgi:hypothetical protein